MDIEEKIKKLKETPFIDRVKHVRTTGKAWDPEKGSLEIGHYYQPTITEIKKMANKSSLYPVGDNDDKSYFASTGWVCPKCGAVLSPMTSFCPFCSPDREIRFTCGSSTGDFFNVDYNKSINKFIEKGVKNG